MTLGKNLKKEKKLMFQNYIRFKMNYIKTLLIVSIFAFALVSCEENNTTNPSDNVGDAAYLPATVGDYWIYKNITIDSDGVELDETIYHDSVTVISKETDGSQELFVYKKLIDVYNESEDEDGDKEYKFFYNDSKIKANMNYILPSNEIIINMINTFLVDVNISQYVTIGDFNATAKWDILPEITIDSLPEVELSGFVLNLKNIKYSIYANKGAETTITIGSKNYQAQEFIITHDITTDGKVAVLPLDGAKLKIEIKLYFAENYGLVAKKVSGANMSYLVMDYDLANGMNSYMVKHND